ncbi:ABC transporter permease [Vallitalea okinawensis]|uniref:ABC transporter permease n=1 Tax=Vallitalea okinawensis TaxID=2078660 RepID=UPI000CFD657A|nr:ABC transporter permease subunit [Vallitalea okinawensis]
MKEYSGYYLMLLPIILWYIIFRYGPMYGIVIAFQDFYPLKGISGSEWVGFKHFKTMFTGLYFLPVLRNTILISFYKLIFGFPAPIILALIFNEIRHKHFKKISQTISYLPHFLSWVIVSGLVIEMLSPSRGLVNYFIQLLGFDPIFFVADPKYFRSVLVGSGIWQGIGWGSIIYLAAISNIDPQLYEAAAIDGATRIQRIRFITLPSLAPVVTIMLIFACGKLIDDNFSQVYNLLNLKVMSVGDVISTYTYEQGLVQMQYSYSTAVGLFKNIVSFSMVFGANAIAKRVSEYGIW